MVLVILGILIILQRSGKGGLNGEQSPQVSGGPDEVGCRTMMMHSLEVSGKTWISSPNSSLFYTQSPQG